MEDTLLASSEGIEGEERDVLIITYPSHKEKDGSAPNSPSMKHNYSTHC